MEKRVNIVNQLAIMLILIMKCNLNFFFSKLIDFLIINSKLVIKLLYRDYFGSLEHMISVKLIIAKTLKAYNLRLIISLIEELDLNLI